MKYAIDTNSVKLLKSIFTQKQEWTVREDPSNGHRKYDVYFIQPRRCLWRLTARLKVRSVPEYVWARGALMGIYRGNNSQGWSNENRHWVSIVLYPLPKNYKEKIYTLGKSDVYWGKNGTLARGSAGGIRTVESPRDPKMIHLRMMGTSTRTWYEMVIGPIGQPTTLNRFCSFPRAKSTMEEVQLFPYKSN